MLLFDTIITFLPLYGYYCQYSLIKNKQSVGSFSIDLCGIMLIANILRIMFWFSNGFAINLLFQSFLVIMFQLILLNLCVKLGYKDSNFSGFWRWNKFSHFSNTCKYLVTFLLFFSTFMGGMTYFSKLYSLENYGRTIGTLALSIQALIGFPQIITNQKSKSVEGLSIAMIIIWFLGDLIKTIYFIQQAQPMQFIISGLVQLICDSIIIGQMIMFTRNSHSKIVMLQNITQQSVIFQTQTKDDDVIGNQIISF